MKIIIFGIGISGRAIYRTFINNPDYTIIGFIDNNEKLYNTTYQNVPIYSPNQLDNLLYDKIALSGVWCNDMTKQLQELHIAKEKIWHIPDNEVIFTDAHRTTLTDILVKEIDTIFSSHNIDYKIGGSSLLCLMRSKNLSDVSDVDIFVTQYKDIEKIVHLLQENELIKKQNIKIVYYLHDKILSKQNQIDKIVIQSNKLSQISEVVTIDINWMFDYQHLFIIDHGPDYLKFEKESIKGNRRMDYKDFSLSIPYKAELFLESLYGKNWIIPATKWSQDDYNNLVRSHELQSMVK